MSDNYVDDGQFYDLTHAEYVHDIEFYVAEASAGSGPCLELGCGTGRLTIAMAQAGATIIGLEPAGSMLEHARRKIAALPAEIQARITVQAGDMRDFKLDQQFGLIMVPARAFTHLLEVEDQLRALDAIRRHLQPGGRLILDIPDPSSITHHMLTRGHVLYTPLAPTGRQLVDPATGQPLIEWATMQFDQRTQRMERWTIYEVVDQTGQTLRRFRRGIIATMLYRREMEHLLVRAGYQIEALYGSFDRKPFGEAGSEQIWIARQA